MFYRLTFFDEINCVYIPARHRQHSGMNKFDMPTILLEEKTVRKTKPETVLKITHKPSGGTATISVKQLETWALRQLREAIK